MARAPDLGRLVGIAWVLIRFGAVRLGGSVLAALPFVGRRVSTQSTPQRRFRALLEELGGTFVKFGQVLSLQPDLVPSSYCDELFDLLDRMPSFDYSEVERTFREDLGRGPSGVFDDFERAPFASASIGQVHRATLAGRPLAVKVRRPDALRDFGGDISLMRAATWLIRRLRLKSLESFRLALDEFVAWTADELDYRREARYMERVRINSAARPRARVPAVIREVSTERILAVEYLEGVTLLEYLRSLERGDPAVAFRLREIGFEPSEFAEHILANFLGDVFRNGIFHADLHPANLLILPDNVVGYVDFGITGMISRYGSRHVLAMILALTRRDADELFEGILAISEVTDQSDVEGFRRELRARADVWFAQDRGGDELATSYTVIMLDLIRLSRRFALLPHEEAMRYMRSVVTADGLIARFAPEFDVDRALERLSREQLEARSLESAFSADRMIDAAMAGARLAQDGGLRLNRWLDRLDRDDRDGRDDSAGRNRRAGRSWRRASSDRALRLALALLALTAMMILGDEPVRLGFNLFAAEALLIGAGLWLLVGTTLRWIRSER